MIPKIAHWIWLNDNLPDWAARNINSFRTLHPDWIIRIWHDLPKEFPDSLRAIFDELLWYSSRSDILRYWLLWEYGGIYLDTDVVALRSFEPLRRHELFLAPCQPVGHDTPHLACALMGSLPRSKPAWKILEACIERASTSEPPRRITYGPDLLSKLFRTPKDGAEILPLHYFYAIPDRETAHRVWELDADARRKALADIVMRTHGVDHPPFSFHLWGVDGSTHRTVTSPDTLPQ